jgi:hypothetical protein
MSDIQTEQTPTAETMAPAEPAPAEEQFNFFAETPDSTRIYDALKSARDKDVIPNDLAVCLANLFICWNKVHALPDGAELLMRVFGHNHSGRHPSHGLASTHGGRARPISDELLADLGRLMELIQDEAEQVRKFGR